MIERLTRVLDARERLDEVFVIIQTLDGRYLQVAFSTDEVYAEAVSNQFLEGGARLTEGQKVLLETLGWSPPRPPEDDGARRPNFFREWSYDTPTETIVMDLARTLASVYLSGEGDSVELIRGAFSGPGWADWADEIPV